MIQENYRLTDSQIEHFKTFGFILRRKVFTRDEIEIMNEEFEKGLKIARQHHAESVGVRGQYNWSNLSGETPTLAALPEDPRIYCAAEQLLGEDAIAVFSNGNHFSGDRTEWHPDISNMNMRGIKFALYLQPLDGNTGALRVIPGSHRSPYHDKLINMGMKGANIGEGDSYLKKAGLEAKDIPAHVCNTEPGDVVTFDFRLWHATWGGSKDRRMCSVNWHKYPHTPQEVEAEKKMLESSRRTREALKFPGPQYPESWLSNPEGNAKRARWIKILDEWGFLESDRELNRMS